MNKHKWDSLFYQTIMTRYYQMRGQKPYLDRRGIYSISLLGKIIYIGKAENMLQRTISHQVNTEFGLKEHKYEIFRDLIKQGYELQFGVMEVVKQKSKLGEREGYWIRELKPIMNYQIPKEDGKHYTVNPIAKKVDAERVLAWVQCEGIENGDIGAGE